MKITNKNNLPEAIVRAIIKDRERYKTGRGDAHITVTQLLKPPRMVALEKKHASTLTEDASERIWALCGAALHQIVENAADGNVVSEKRYSTEVHGWTVSGQVDHYDPATRELTDFKFVGAFSVREGPKEEWTNQMNLLAHLMAANDAAVDDMQIIAIIRDWSGYEARMKPDYPPQQVQCYQIMKVPSTMAERYMVERVKLHQAAQAAENQDQLPECTEEERWKRPDKFAIYKAGAARALKLFDNEHDAIKHQAGLIAEWMKAGKSEPPPFKLVTRHGASRRCEEYCAVACVCKQWQKLQEGERVG